MPSGASTLTRRVISQRTASAAMVCAARLLRVRAIPNRLQRCSSAPTSVQPPPKPPFGRLRPSKHCIDLTPMAIPLRPLRESVIPVSA